MIYVVGGVSFIAGCGLGWIVGGKAMLNEFKRQLGVY